MNEQDVIDCFLAYVPYIPELAGSQWIPAKQLLVGNDLAIGLSKKLDLVLIQRMAGATDQLEMIFTTTGIPFSGKRVNIISLFAMPPVKNVWIVEAESRKEKLWEAIGQAYCYSVLFARDYQFVRVQGAMITYPEQQGADESIESAVQILNSAFPLRLGIIKVPCEERQRRRKGDPNQTDLGFFGGNIG